MNGKGIAIVAGVAAMAVALGAQARSKPMQTPAKDGGTNKVTLWRLLMALPLDMTQRYFLMLVAKGEGNYNPAAHNGTAGERAAAARALQGAQGYEITQRAMQCGVPAAALASGSWGTFQQLAPYLAKDGYAVAGCAGADPTNTTLELQVVCAIRVARRLQNYAGWLAYPTVGNLRLGWATPSWLGYLADHQEKLDKYRRHAAEAGLPDGIVDARVERFPEGDAGMLHFAESIT